MVQKLNVQAFALASALVCAVVYVVCASLSWISPQFIVAIGDYLAHSIDLTKIISTSMTLSSAFIGFILTVTLSYAISGSFAWMYNKILK